MSSEVSRMDSDENYLDATSDASTTFNAINKKPDKDVLNQQLYSFLKSTNLEMDYDIFW